MQSQIVIPLMKVIEATWYKTGWLNNIAYFCRRNLKQLILFMIWILQTDLKDHLNGNGLS
jgi:hypothetical protein